MLVGTGLGAVVGAVPVGLKEGPTLGLMLGLVLGAEVGPAVVGRVEGRELGAMVGDSVGSTRVGASDGKRPSLSAGAEVGATPSWFVTLRAFKEVAMTIPTRTMAATVMRDVTALMRRTPRCWRVFLVSAMVESVEEDVWCTWCFRELCCFLFCEVSQFKRRAWFRSESMITKRRNYLRFLRFPRPPALAWKVMIKHCGRTLRFD